MSRILSRKLMSGSGSITRTWYEDCEISVKDYRSGGWGYSGDYGTFGMKAKMNVEKQDDDSIYDLIFQDAVGSGFLCKVDKHKGLLDTCRLLPNSNSIKFI